MCGNLGSPSPYFLHSLDGHAARIAHLSQSWLSDPRHNRPSLCSSLHLWRVTTSPFVELSSPEKADKPCRGMWPRRTLLMMDPLPHETWCKTSSSKQIIFLVGKGCKNPRRRAGTHTRGPTKPKTCGSNNTGAHHPGSGPEHAHNDACMQPYNRSVLGAATPDTQPTWQPNQLPHSRGERCRWLAPSGASHGKLSGA